MNEKHGVRAFSLIEVLVAMVVLSLMVALLAGILKKTSDALATGGGDTERRQNLRAFAENVVRELEAALIPLDPSDSQNLQFVVNPPSLAAKYKHADCLFWQAPIATNQQYGDIAAIGYFLRWDTSTPGNPRPLFCRFFVNPNEPEYRIYKNSSAWISDDLLETVAPAVVDAQNPASPQSYRGLFSENVIGFWVRCYDSTAAPSIPMSSYDSRSSMRLPRSVKLTLAIIDSEALPRITAIPDYTKAVSVGANDEPDLDAFIASLPSAIRGNVRTFTTEVRLQNAP